MTQFFVYCQQGHSKLDRKKYLDEIISELLVDASMLKLEEIMQFSAKEFLDVEENAEQVSLLLRFQIGTRVKCWTQGKRDAKIYEHGIVVQHFYRDEQCCNEDHRVPYQVLLDIGREVTAKWDEDEIIQKTEWDASVLRFPIGHRVQCNYGASQQHSACYHDMPPWPTGTVIEHFHHEKTWKIERVACYFVLLDYGAKIWAPNDNDEIIREANEGLPMSQALSLLLQSPRMPINCWREIWNFFSFGSFKCQGVFGTPEMDLRVMCKTFSQSISKPTALTVCKPTHDEGDGYKNWIPVCAGPWRRASVDSAISLVRSMRKRMDAPTRHMKINIEEGEYELCFGDTFRTDTSFPESLKLRIDDISNLTFVGKGKICTVLEGCIYVTGSTGIAFENVTFTNRNRDPANGHALHVSQASAVSVVNSEVINCKGTGAVMLMGNLSALSMDSCRILYHRQNGIHATDDVRLNLTNCEINHCKGAAVVAGPGAVVHFYGTYFFIFFFSCFFELSVFFLTYN